MEGVSRDIERLLSEENKPIATDAKHVLQKAKQIIENELMKHKLHLKIKR